MMDEADLPPGARIIHGPDELPSEIDPAEVGDMFDGVEAVVIAGFPTEEDEANRLIDPTTVETIHIDCLMPDAEMAEGVMPVVVDGLVQNYAYSRTRLEKHRAEVKAMLAFLPIEFRPQSEGGGGGWSFLYAAQDKNGTLWTGLQRRSAQLLCLGTALGYVKCQVPRSMWNVMPGGVPYYEVRL